ncbi:Uu.00g103620.m01.CDS01 [Anthostomella pinea]|uniref:Uu.00g103620.m01.CDS01 n=1 Tax=Anthostomella pinea TaxID=933095 RepID=A0AAI8YFM4_9PEZI|nr:Uu.00g103620.m01.CDS01 [Anthostomella pinea]
MASPFQNPGMSSPDPSGPVATPANELRPAPLRIRPRKSDITSEDSSSSHKQHVSEVREFSTTLLRKAMSRHPTPVSSEAPSQHRTISHKLGSLVSKFEVLDAENSMPAGASRHSDTAQKARPSGIPRASGGLRQAMLPELIPQSPSSVELPPRQVPAPAASERRRSMLPVSTRTPIAKADETTAGHSPFSKAVKSEPSPLRLPMSASSRQDSPAKAESSTPASVKVWRTPRDTKNTPEKAEFSDHASIRAAEATRQIKTQKLSVADLRKSFEQGARPASTRAKTPEKSKLRPQTPPSALGRTHRVELKSKQSEQFTPTPPPPMVSSRVYSPTKALLTSSQSKQKSKETGATKPVAGRAEEGSQHPKGFGPWTDGSSGIYLQESQKPSKVSTLRKFFDRPLLRASSPMAFMHLRRNRGHMEPPVSEPHPHFSTYFPAESTATFSTHTTVQRRAHVPSPALTTEISINDFSCDFIGDAKQPGEFDALHNSQSKNHGSRKYESPVKDRVQQFERLDSNAPSVKTPTHDRAKSHDTVLHFAFKARERNDEKKPSPSGWHPIRQRGTAIWRRISNSFRHSVDSCSDDSSSTDSDEPGSSSSDDVKAEGTTRPSPSPPQRLYRRSSRFGYHLYRTSEEDRPAASYSSGGESSSIDIPHELTAKLENRPPPMSHVRRFPSHRRVSMRKSFPFMTRESSGIDSSVRFDFGLDGAILTKMTRKDGKQAASEDIPQAHQEPSPFSAAQQDPEALQNVLSKHSVAERKRRKREEKQRRRDEKARKKEEKGKGKEIAREYAYVVPSAINRPPGILKKENEKQRSVEAHNQRAKSKSEKSWEPKTTSGFVVRLNEAEMNSPKPARPGQVKRIVNMFKDKSASTMFKDKSTSGLRLGSKGNGGGSAA